MTESAQASTDNVAILKGYTEAVTVHTDATSLFLLVRPNTDFDDAFRAFDTDEQEFIRVNGWLITDVERGH